MTLNNVLAPIVTAMEVLRLRTRDEKSREMLALMGGHARRGKELIQQITTLAEGIEGCAPKSNRRIYCETSKNFWPNICRRDHPGIRGGRGFMGDVGIVDADLPGRCSTCVVWRRSGCRMAAFCG